MKQVAGKIKGDLAQYRELAAFAQFGSDLDAKTQAKLDRGARVVEVFNQKNYHPVPVELQVAILWAVQNNFFDKVPVDKVKDFQTKLVDFLTTRQEAILAELREKAAFDDDITAQLKPSIGHLPKRTPSNVERRT